MERGVPNNITVNFNAPTCEISVSYDAVMQLTIVSRRDWDWQRRRNYSSPSFERRQERSVDHDASALPRLTDRCR
jgi:hypothetical protein